MAARQGEHLGRYYLATEQGLAHDLFLREPNHGPLLAQEKGIPVLVLPLAVVGQAGGPDVRLIDFNVDTQARCIAVYEVGKVPAFAQPRVVDRYTAINENGVCSKMLEQVLQKGGLATTPSRW